MSSRDPSAEPTAGSVDPPLSDQRVSERVAAAVSPVDGGARVSTIAGRPIGTPGSQFSERPFPI